MSPCSPFQNLTFRKKISDESLGTSPRTARGCGGKIHEGRQSIVVCSGADAARPASRCCVRSKTSTAFNDNTRTTDQTVRGHENTACPMQTNEILRTLKRWWAFYSQVFEIMVSPRELRIKNWEIDDI